MSRIDAEVRGALAIDHDAQLGLVEFQRGVGVDDAAELLRSLDEFIGIAGELRCPVHENEVDVERPPAPKLNDCALRTPDTHRRVLLGAAGAPPASRPAACSFP